MVDIFFIRHAESTGNVNNHLIGGRSDHLALTPRGEEQARRLGQRLHREGISFDKVFSSVAIRAHETARIACSQIPTFEIPISLDERLVESSQGTWEGELRKEVLTPQVREKIAQDPQHFKAPGGESLFEVEERMYGCLQEIIQSQNGETHKIGIFSHGMAIRCLFRKLTEASFHLPRNMVTHNTSITRYIFDSGDFLVERVNDHSHLLGMEFVEHYG